MDRMRRGSAGERGSSETMEGPTLAVGKRTLAQQLEHRASSGASTSPAPAPLLATAPIRTDRLPAVSGGLAEAFEETAGAWAEGSAPFHAMAAAGVEGPATKLPPEARASSPPVQRKAPAPVMPTGPRPTMGNMSGGAPAAADLHASAQRGIATPAMQLPCLEQIQRSFGRHDVSGVKAHVGGDAAASTREMGAQAYATGDHVVLGTGTDLHTVVHEAAHVVQQRAGVQLLDGVGQCGDAYEIHADAVADRVVAGQSAEALLDELAPSGARGGTPSVQRALTGAQITATGDHFEKQLSTGRNEKSAIELMEQIVNGAFDATNAELAQLVKFLFSELDAAKSEHLRQQLFARGGQAAQLAIDRTIEQIAHYTALGDTASVAWLTNTTPGPLQARLTAHHGQGALPNLNAVPTSANAPILATTLEVLFMANHAGAGNPNDTVQLNGGALGPVPFRSGHAVTRHTIERFQFTSNNIFRGGGYDATEVNGMFPIGTNVQTLAEGLLQGELMSPIQAARFAGLPWIALQAGGYWCGLAITPQLSFVQLYPVSGGHATTAGDLKQIAINRGYGDYAGHAETTVNAAVDYGGINYNVTTHETFASGRQIDHWTDGHGQARHTESKNAQVWGWQQDGDGDLEHRARPYGAWTARQDDADQHGRWNQTSGQTEYEGRRNGTSGPEFLFPNANPAPADWRELHRGQGPNGGVEITTNDLPVPPAPGGPAPAPAPAIQSGMRLNDDGTVEKHRNGAWSPYAGTEAEQQAADRAAYNEGQNDALLQLAVGGPRIPSNDPRQPYRTAWQHFLDGYAAAEAATPTAVGLGTPLAVPADPRPAYVQGFAYYTTEYQRGLHLDAFTFGESEAAHHGFLAAH
jgi:hypothetical protein